MTFESEPMPLVIEMPMRCHIESSVCETPSHARRHIQTVCRKVENQPFDANVQIQTTGRSPGLQRNSRFNILPDGPLGKLSMNSTLRLTAVPNPMQ